MLVVSIHAYFYCTFMSIITNSGVEREAEQHLFYSSIRHITETFIWTRLVCFEYHFNIMPTTIVRYYVSYIFHFTVRFDFTLKFCLVFVSYSNEIVAQLFFSRTTPTRSRFINVCSCKLSIIINRCRYSPGETLFTHFNRTRFIVLVYSLKKPRKFSATQMHFRKLRWKIF